MSKVKTMTAEQLDKLVDESKEDVLQYFDLENARRGESRRINIDLPSDFLAGLDREAARRGITRQSLIKVWLYDRLHNSGINISGELEWIRELTKTALRGEASQNVKDLQEALKKAAQDLEGAHFEKRGLSGKKG